MLSPWTGGSGSGAHQPVLCERASCRRSEFVVFLSSADGRGTAPRLPLGIIYGIRPIRALAWFPTGFLIEGVKLEARGAGSGQPVAANCLPRIQPGADGREMDDNAALGTRGQNRDRDEPEPLSAGIDAEFSATKLRLLAVGPG
jgi:hypothetical protein